MRLTEKEVIQSVKRMGELYAPLKIKLIAEQISLPEGYRVSAVIEISIQNGPSFEAVVEIAPVATPQNILKRARQLVDYLGQAKKPNIVPLVIAPYIGAKQAQILSEKDISWIDLCGNMRITAPGKIYIERTGNKNKFPDTTPIKKIFEGTSSLVCRALLLRPEGFSSQYELVNFINSRNANITAGTVSRVLKSLEDDLLITKERSLISIIDNKRLLQSLADGYMNHVKRKERKSYRFSIQQPPCVSLWKNVNKSNYLACGFYAAQIKRLASTDEKTIFVKDILQARKEFNFLEPDAEFGNFKFIETNDVEIWFNSVETELTIDSTIKVSIPVVDDIELYLEMINDVPRGPRVAELLKERILRANYNG